MLQETPLESVGALIARFSLIAPCVGALTLVPACSTSESWRSQDGDWVGTIEMEGSITTVWNTRGSVWGGKASLVEEISTGVAVGEPQYMFGNIYAVWDAGDRIFLTDQSVPAVRVYDGEGNYLGDVGRQGQGPGEYQIPFSVATLADGRILVTDGPRGESVDVFGSDFEYLERWGPFTDQLTAPGARLQPLLTVGADGEPYMRYTEFASDSPGNEQSRRYGWRSVGPDGVGPPIWLTRLEFEPWRTCLGCLGTIAFDVRYAPFATEGFLPTADTVTGINEEYRFEIRRPDGSTVVVHRYWDPVPVSDAEQEYWMSWERAWGLARDPGWRRTGPDVPRHKPAFEVFYRAQDGRILVERLGPSHRVEPCTENPEPEDQNRIPCWQSTRIWDVFDNEGRYLGEIEPPPDRRRLPAPFFDGDRLTMATEDEAGTIRIKRYRLVLPAERSNEGGPGD